MAGTVVSAFAASGSFLAVGLTEVMPGKGAACLSLLIKASTAFLPWLIANAGRPSAVGMGVEVTVTAVMAVICGFVFRPAQLCEISKSSLC
mgnify:CR=1 FL=1